MRTRARGAPALCALFLCPPGPGCALEPPGAGSAHLDEETRRVEELRAELRGRTSGAVLYSLAKHSAEAGLTAQALGALTRLDRLSWDAPRSATRTSPRWRGARTTRRSLAGSRSGSQSCTAA